jgi:hypothetical protein
VRRFCDRACASAFARRDRPSDEWLRQKYEDEGLTAVDLAHLFSKDPKTTWLWLRQAGVETRPRGSYDTFALSGAEHGNRLGVKHTEEAKTKIREAWKTRDPKSYAGNGPWRGKFGEDHPQWKGGCTPERQAFYSSDEWKAVACLVWGRDKGVCRRCEKHSERTPDPHKRWHIHHIVSFMVKELRADPNNLVLLCPPCHRWVHGKFNLNKEFLG